MIDLNKKAPGLVPLAKKAAACLEKNSLAGQKFSVYLLMNHSGSTQPFYRRESKFLKTYPSPMEKLSDQALAISSQVDDDGIVFTTYFHSFTEPIVNLEIGKHQGFVNSTHPSVRWGSTDYAGAMQHVTSHYERTQPGVPALVIFQTDGNPDNKEYAERVLRQMSSKPIFWAFVGFGNNVSFLEKLDELGGRVVDNASFFHARNPHSITDEEMFQGITGELARWLRDCRSNGII